MPRRALAAAALMRNEIIDDVRIYHEALTATEAQAVYNAA